MKYNFLALLVFSIFCNVSSAKCYTACLDYCGTSTCCDREVVCPDEELTEPTRSFDYKNTNALKTSKENTQEQIICFNDKSLVEL
ncbi:MAG: hypothetical protein HOE90_08055 [Bacteriovoracaceae bacterium]|jgi:hypothetical protein|nr:hypothetical protein [Bacteriovoracaceae bacterium]